MIHSNIDAGSNGVCGVSCQFDQIGCVTLYLDCSELTVTDHIVEYAQSIPEIFMGILIRVYRER